MEPSGEKVGRVLGRHPYLREVGGFAMQHSLASIYGASTVVGSPEVTVRGRWGNAEAGFVGEELLLNYRPDGADLGFQLGIGRFFEHDAILASAHAELEEDPHGAIELPRSKRLRTGLSAVFQARRSKRSFSSRKLSLQDLSTLLQHTAGVSGHLAARPGPGDPEVPIKVRTAPSGGGLYPISLFVAPFNVDGLEPRFHQYLPLTHALRPVGATDTDRLAHLCRSPDFDVSHSAFALVYVYDLYKNSRKYGDSGVVFGFIEVGAISQNLHLTRTAMGLAGCCQGGYDKQALERAIDLDGTSRHVVHLSVIGHEE